MKSIDRLLISQDAKTAVPITRKKDAGFNLNCIDIRDPHVYSLIPFLYAIECKFCITLKSVIINNVILRLTQSNEKLESRLSLIWQGGHFWLLSYFCPELIDNVGKMLTMISKNA